MLRAFDRSLPFAFGALTATLLWLTDPESAAQAGAVLAITRVTVIDGTGSAPLREATVVIRDGRIEQVGTSRTVRIPDSATSIDGTDKFLIPGLIDTHFHIAGRIGRPELDRILAAALAHGVTGIRDASGQGREQQLVELRDEIERGTRPGPHLYVSGGATTQNLTRYKAADPAALVRQLREIGVDGVKLRNFRSEPALAAIRAAKSERLPVYGHTYGPGPTDDFTSEALAAGVSGVMHVLGAGPGRTIRSAPDKAEGWQRDWLTSDLRWADATAEEESTLLKSMVAARAWLEPTLSTNTVVIEYEKYRVRPEMSLNAVLFGQPFEEIRKGFPNFEGADLALARAAARRAKQFVRRFHEAGGLIIAGSDMTPWPAAGVHEELRLLVDAGLSPMAALQAATRNAATALGWQARRGTIAHGHDADLVLLDADPVRDIANTTRICAVIRGGKYLDRAALDRLVSAADVRAR